MCEWYHRTLAGGTLALDAPLMLYVIRRFLRQVESRAVGGDVCALRDAMVELVADYEWRTSMKSEDRKFKRPFPPTPSPPACHLARRARAGGALPSSVRRRRPPASDARMGAWGRRGGAFGVAALGGQADRALDRFGGATQRQPGARDAGGRGAGWQPGAAKLRPAPRQRAGR